MAWLLLLEAACLGSFVALDLILFFLFFELTLVPVYFIVAGWGFARRAYAAMKFFLYTFLGSAFLLVGIVAVAIIHERQTGVFTFDLVSLTHTHLGLGSQILLFLAFTVGLRREGAHLPLPHLVARRLRRGAGGGIGDPGRRDGQAGHLRDHPLRPEPVPPGRGRPGPAAAHPGGDRDPLRGHRGLCHQGPEAAGGLFVAGPPRFHRARAPSPSPPRPSPAASSRW